MSLGRDPTLAAPAREVRAIADLLDREDVLILDTETTGMGAAEVIEVAVIDTKGTVLVDTLVRPKATRMNPYAQRVHGITFPMLADAPTWPEVFPSLAERLDRATVLAWNAPFDRRMLEQTSAVWSLEHPRFLFVCAMRLYAKTRGIRPRALHKVLGDLELSHLTREHASHRALGDVHFVLEILRRVAA